MTRKSGWFSLTAAFAVAIACGLGLAGCGGGGGGGGDGGGSGGGGGGAATTFNLSGTIAIAETAAVDSDTNDVKQAGYLPNDTAATAQVLTAPVLLVGSVNLPNTGPRGRNNDGSTTLGDDEDWFRVDLVAGQVVELEFASDPANADVDLYVISSDATLGGQSIGTDRRFECVTVTRTGSYYVIVNAFSRASIYNLRVGAPGTSATCAQATAPVANFIAGQLVAEARRGVAGALEKAGTLVRAAGVTVADSTEASAGTLRADAGPQLLRLPRDPVASAMGLKTLADIAAGGDGRSRARSASGVANDVARRAKAAATPWPASLVTMRYAKQLRATGAFEYVEPNLVMRSTAITGAFPPNDRAYSYQRWHYEQINLPSAMSRVTGLNLPGTQARPLVAVIDSGVVLDHPDLAPQLFSAGRAFSSGSVAGDGDRNSGDDVDPAASQPVFHGTHVAGTVGAATYDGIGGAGTAPMALILPLRVLVQGRGSSLDVIQAMRYAAALSNRSGFVPVRRADVINLSLGSDNACDSAYQQAMNDVRAAGTLVVAAAGNEARTTVGSPASCTGVIAVSATDAQRNIARYSNTGTRVVVAGPGGDTSVSTTGNGAPDGVYSDIGAFDSNGRRQPSFGPLDGTSMASPHVTGVMALMRFVNPGLTVAQVDNLFAAGSLTDDLGAAGRDNQFGFGLINARKAVDAALAALSAPPPASSAPIVALPSTLDFGAVVTSGVLELSASGTSAEAVAGTPQVAVPAGTAAGAVTVVATSVNAAGLGRWTVTVNRAAFSGNGTFYPSVRFTLNTGRVITVQLTVQKPATAGGGGTAAAANWGALYVLLIDPATGKVEHTVLATLSGGRYSWSKTGYAKSKVSIIAGGDQDNDDFICQRGEPCGAYPVLQQRSDLTVIELTGHRSDLNFQVSPLAGISPSAIAGAGSGPVFQRTPAEAVPEVMETVP